MTGREKVILLLLVIVGAYFLGYYRVTPQSLSGGKFASQSPHLGESSAHTRPTPYQPPAGAGGRQ
jgi:hypothetical protein